MAPGNHTVFGGWESSRMARERRSHSIWSAAFAQKARGFDSDSAYALSKGVVTAPPLYAPAPRPPSAASTPGGANPTALAPTALAPAALAPTALKQGAHLLDVDLECAVLDPGAIHAG